MMCLVLGCTRAVVQLICRVPCPLSVCVCYLCVMIERCITVSSVCELPPSSSISLPLLIGAGCRVVPLNCTSSLLLLLTAAAAECECCYRCSCLLLLLLALRTVCSSCCCHCGHATVCLCLSLWRCLGPGCGAFVAVALFHRDSLVPLLASRSSYVALSARFPSHAASTGSLLPAHLLRCLAWVRSLFPPLRSSATAGPSGPRCLFPCSKLPGQSVECERCQQRL